MHELGIVVHIIRTVQASAEENNIHNVKKICIIAGELCGAVPQFLKKLFPVAIHENQMFSECELAVETEVAVANCKSCGNSFEVTKKKGVCPYCHESNYEVVKGTQLFIRNYEGY